MTLLEILSIDLPIIQAPMAGVSSPAMAAAVSNAGALGSIGVGRLMRGRAQNDCGGPRALQALLNVMSSATSRRQSTTCLRHPGSSAYVLTLSDLCRTSLSVEGDLSEFCGRRCHVGSAARGQAARCKFSFGLPSSERIHALREAGIVLWPR